MILERKTDTLILEEGEVQESTNMEIDADSHIFLMRMLSKFYSDGIGSLIRETCSNALDSHRAAGVDDPIIVRFKSTTQGGYEFSVEDFGCGIDDQDVENIIKKYGKSTKRASVNQLGAFGLGFKSPLAYTSSFYFIGRKNGIERKWMLYESDDESNKIDLLHEMPTTERNGVKIIVPVNKYSDRNDFIFKMKSQLAYFENVYFDCPEINNSNIKIVRSEHFQWSSLTSDSAMHICLDNVYYPMDFAKLGIRTINFPVGLRFSLTDGLFPIPNREQLKYTEDAKAVILAKIKKVADYFINLYNENVKDTDDLFAVIEHYSRRTRYVEHLAKDGRRMDVKELEHLGTINFINPKLTTVKLLDMNRLNHIKDCFIYPYTVKYILQNGRFNLQKRDSWRHTLNFSSIPEEKDIYIYTELSHLKKIYLRDIYRNRTIKFLKKERHLPLGRVSSRFTGRGLTDYMNILELWKHPKSEWRERIKEFQTLQAYVESKFIDADKIEIPDSWIEGRKKERLQKMAVKGTNIRRQKLEGEVSGKIASSLERYVSGKNCKFTPIVLPMKIAHKQPYLLVYGETSQEDIMQKLFPMFNSTKVKFMLFSSRELKNLQTVELHNWITLEKFMKGEHKVFKRAVTAYLIDQLSTKYSHVFYRLDTIQEISVSLHHDLSLLYSYAREHFKDGDRATFDSMVKVAEEFKLFDTEMYTRYKQVKGILDRLPFIEPMCKHMPRYESKEMIEALKDLFRYYKQRIDWQNYLPPVIEEDVVETEETVEEEINI